MTMPEMLKTRFCEENDSALIAPELLDLLAEAVFVLGPGGRILHANRAVLEVFGHGPGSLVGHPVSVVVAPAERAARKAELDAYFEDPEGTLWSGVLLQGYRAGSVEFPLRLEIAPFGSGNDRQFVAVAEDMSRVDQLQHERDRAREALSLQDESFRILFESSHDLVHKLSLDGRYLQVNTAYLESLGYTWEELSMLSVMDVIHPDDHPHCLEVFREVSEGKRTPPTRVRFRTRMGDVRELEGAPSPVVANGEVTSILGVFRDVTEGRRMMTALQESREQLRSFFDHAPGGILIYDLETNCFVDMNHNAEAILGMSRERLLNIPGTDLARQLERDEVFDMDAIRDAVAEAVSGNPTCRDWPVPLADGRHLWCEVHVTRLPGKHPRLYFDVRDITQRRSLEQQVRQAQKMEAVGQLTAGITHDFNNLLSVIGGSAEILALDTEGALSESVEEIETIRETVSQGSTLIRKLLSFARKADLGEEDCDLQESAGELVSVLARLLPKTIEVRVDRSEGDFLARADQGAFTQILMNIATNARDAMPDGGELVFSCRHETRPDPESSKPCDFVVVSGRDTGSGMDPETVEKIFEPFYTTKAEGEGTGLGMPMIAGLVHQHGGFVEVDSAVGTGTTVSLFFPAVDSQSPVDEPREDEGLVALVVDDDAPIRQMVRRVLARRGIAVEEAEDGLDALEKLRVGHFSLVLSDVAMPNLNGPSLYREMKKEGIDVPFLLTSGFTGKVEESLPAGVPFVPKPWTTADLWGAVQAVLPELDLS